MRSRGYSETIRDIIKELYESPRPPAWHFDKYESPRPPAWHFDNSAADPLTARIRVNGAIRLLIGFPSADDEKLSV
jgi:hypothetical protein